MMRCLFALCVVLAVATIACEEPPATEPVARGRQLYRKLDCGRCHFIDGQGGRLAPELTHIGTVADTRRPGATDEEYIRESIVSPGAYIVPGFNDVMPRGLTRMLSAKDLDALILFLRDHE
jgi:cytochrome c oxidase subunit 2